MKLTHFNTMFPTQRSGVTAAQTTCAPGRGGVGLYMLGLIGYFINNQLHHRVLTTEPVLATEPGETIRREVMISESPSL